MCAPHAASRGMRFASLAIFLVLLLPHGTQAAASTSYVIPLGPIRQDWGFAGGFCGEVSIQQTALYHGAWVGQAQARKLGGGELLLGENLENVVEKLGFRSAAWRSDASQAAVSKDVPSKYLQQYMAWMKQQVLRNYTVIFGAHIKGGTNSEYDHIMPAFGVHLRKAPGSLDYDPLDELTWSNDYGQVIRRAMGAPGFFASKRKCTISDALGGCIPSDTSTYALAMGPLRNANSLFRPLRMVVTGWSDKSTAIAEPLVAKAAQASYALDLKDSGLKQGDAFTLFRCDGAGALPRDPRTILDMRRAPKCKASAPQTMQPGLVLNEQLMGKIASNSVVYFACVSGK